MASSAFSGSYNNIVVNANYKPQRGDLVLFGNTDPNDNDYGKFSHVGIMANENEDIDAHGNEIRIVKDPLYCKNSDDGNIIGFFTFNTGGQSYDSRYVGIISSSATGGLDIHSTPDYNSSSAFATMPIGSLVIVDPTKAVSGTTITYVNYNGRWGYASINYINASSSKINASTFTASYTSSVEYTGSNICPSVSVSYYGMALTEGKDYTLQYSNNTNPGDAQIVITGIGNLFTGTKTEYFKIIGSNPDPQPVDPKKDWYIGTISSSATGGLVLHSTPDYNDSSAITVMPIGSLIIVDPAKAISGTTIIYVNYNGQWGYASKNYINTTSSKIGASSFIPSYSSGEIYSGSPFCPDVSVSYYGIQLIEGTDYTLQYSNNINVGNGQIIINGCGHLFTGSKSLNITIYAKDINKCTISSITNQTYTGSALTPTVTVKDGTKTLTSGTDYTVAYSNNINAGTATVTITGKGNYTGTKTATFKIVARSIANCTVSAIAEQTYTGSALTPAVAVKDGAKTLTKGTDYTVSYSNNINAGTATVTITGKGNYTGTKTATFTIKAAVPVVTATPGDAQVILKWNAVPDADKYAAYIVNADGTLKALATKLTGTTYTAAKLTNGTTYKFLVRAYVDNSWSKYTDKDIVVATPISTRPEIIEATAGDSEVALTWTTVDGAEKYAVYCVDAAGSTKCLSSRLTTASYTAKKLTNGKAYKFYVRAYVNGTWSKFTAADMVQRTPVCLRPSVKAEAGDAQVTLTWSAINGAEKYAAYRVGSDGTLKALSTRLETTEYTAKKLTNGTKYKFLVRAYVNGKWTPYDSTNMVTCTPVSSKPVVKATAGNGQVTLNWGKVTGASKYAVYVVNSDNTLKCLTSKLTANTYTVKNLVNGKTYKYVVRAYVNGAWSKYTTADYVSATPKA